MGTSNDGTETHTLHPFSMKQSLVALCALLTSTQQTTHLTPPPGTQAHRRINRCAPVCGGTNRPRTSLQTGVTHPTSQRQKEMDRLTDRHTVRTLIVNAHAGTHMHACTPHTLTCHTHTQTVSEQASKQERERERERERRTHTERKTERDRDRQRQSV